MQKKLFINTAIIVVKDTDLLEEFFKFYYKYNIKNIVLISDFKIFLDKKKFKSFNFNFSFIKKKKHQKNFDVIKKIIVKLPKYFFLSNGNKFINENLFSFFLAFKKRKKNILFIKKIINNEIINTDFFIINKNNLFKNSVTDIENSKNNIFYSDKEFFYFNKKIKNIRNSKIKFFAEIYSKNILLDRDGVINVDKGYVSSKRRFIWQKGALKAIKYLNDKKYNIFIITNQSGVARGYFSEKDVINLHSYIRDELQKKNCYINKIYYSPFHIDGIISKYTLFSNTRKPGTGLFHILEKEWNVKIKEDTYMIGDQKSDMQFAQNCGIKGLLFKSGRLDRILKVNNI